MNGSDEVDLMILNALQYAPRASWAEIGSAIGLAPTTVARRWVGLSERGEAWIGAYVASPHSRLAFAQVGVEPGSAPEVESALCRMPSAVTVEEVSGRYDIIVTIATGSTDRLADEIRHIRQLAGVRASEVVVSTALLTHGSAWRLDALDPAQLGRIRRVAGDRPSPPMPRIDSLDRDLAYALSRDGRTSFVALAREFSVSVNQVRRRLARLMDSGWLTVRCDMSRAVSGHEIAVVLWLDVPPDRLAECSEAVVGITEARLAAGIAGRHNLMLVVWLRRPEDLPPLELRLTGQNHRIAVADRTVVLRTVKHLGRVLGPDGRVTAVVPPRFWMESGDADGPVDR